MKSRKSARITVVNGKAIDTTGPRNLILPPEIVEEEDAGASSKRTSLKESLPDGECLFQEGLNIRHRQHEGARV